MLKDVVIFNHKFPERKLFIDIVERLMVLEADPNPLAARL